MHVSLSFAGAYFPELVGSRAKQSEIHQSSSILIALLLFCSLR
jgi:hypothetical protein